MDFRRAVFHCLKELSRYMPKQATRLGSSLGYKPFGLSINKRTDVEKVLLFLEEAGKIPTIAHGMEVLGMTSLLEWFWNMEAICQRQSPYTHRSLKPYIFLPGLKTKMVFDSHEFSWASTLEASYDVLREEVLQALEKQVGFRPYRNVENVESKNYAQGWNMLNFHFGGKRIEENAALCPHLVEMVEAIPGLASYSYFTLSALNPGAIITPHCGAMNGLLRVHFGIVGCNQQCFIRVGDQITQWEDGKSLIFDDSFEHQVCHNGDITRIVVWFDVKHPDWPEEDFARFKELMERHFLSIEWYDDQIETVKRDRQMLAGQRWWTS